MAKTNRKKPSKALGRSQMQNFAKQNTRCGTKRTHAITKEVKELKKIKGVIAQGKLVVLIIPAIALVCCLTV